MKTQSVAVFCGSNEGKNAIYARHARRSGKLIAANGLKLVYGGGKKGLMGIVADAVLGAEGKVMGVMPKVLVEWEQQHEGLTELTVVPDMHSRKKMMYEMSDAAIILPGGFGTLDEFFEMLTWNQLKIHDKKIYILNSGGFYDHLKKHLLLMEQQGFFYEPLHRADVCSAMNPWKFSVGSNSLPGFRLLHCYTDTLYGFVEIASITIFLALSRIKARFIGGYNFRF